MSGDTVKLDRMMNAGWGGVAQYGVGAARLADGTELTRQQLIRLATTGTAGDDRLHGSAWADAFDGGAGNDTLSGAGGADVYAYARNGGNDVVDDRSGSTGEADVLRLVDLNPADVLLSRSGHDLLVTDASTGQSVKVARQFYSRTENWGVEHIEFADGTAWDHQTVNAGLW